MNTFTVTKGRLKGTQIQARDKAHAQKLHKARLKRLKDKEMTFTYDEVQALLHLLDTQVGSLSREELQQECEADDFGLFGITSVEQADSIFDKLSYLATQIEKMRTNKEQA